MELGLLGTHLPGSGRSVGFGCFSYQCYKPSSSWRQVNYYATYIIVPCQHSAPSSHCRDLLLLHLHEASSVFLLDKCHPEWWCLVEGSGCGTTRCCDFTELICLLQVVGQMRVTDGVEGFPCLENALALLCFACVQWQAWPQLQGECP